MHLQPLLRAAKMPPSTYQVTIELEKYLAKRHMYIPKPDYIHKSLFMDSTVKLQLHPVL